MTRKLLGGTAIVVMLTTGLVACDRHKEVAQAPTFTDAQLAAADQPTVAKVMNGQPGVPVMAPTGDMAQAVKPAMPSEKSRGEAPLMAPTGDTMPAYTPPATTPSTTQ
jgi:hypothetical protein